MSPEQAEGKELDARSDLFSLGSMMYAMCAGRPAFDGESAVAILRQVADKPAPRLSNVVPETPEWLIAIIEKLMAKSPDDRFQSAAEVTALLGVHVHELQMEIAGTDAARVSVTDFASGPSIAASDSRWKPVLISSLLLLAVIVAAAFGVDRFVRKDSVNQTDGVQESNGDQVNADLAADGKGWHGLPVDAPPPAIAPFDADQALAHQEAWAKYLGVPVDYTNGIGMKFMLIPPGEFAMGSTATEIAEALRFAYDEQWAGFMKSEALQHQVVLTKPIYMGQYEVTQAEYRQVMKNNPSRFAAEGSRKEAVAGLDTSDFPVEMVSWNGAAEFCARLSSLDELTPRYVCADKSVTLQEGTGYRLPTEAQWEFSCRAGTTTRFWSGDQDDNLPFKPTVRRTNPVGQFRANPFGLYGLHGNVWKWVEDAFSPTAYLDVADQPAIDPFTPGKNGAEKTVRGGNWGNSPALCRASMRSACAAGDNYNGIGFRVVLPFDAVRHVLKKQDAARESASNN